MVKKDDVVKKDGNVIHAIISATEQESSSSSLLKIHYVGVAGLGHHLMCMSNAYHLANALELTTGCLLERMLFQMVQTKTR
jgi:hypothetical protein